MVTSGSTFPFAKILVLWCGFCGALVLAHAKITRQMRVASINRIHRLGVIRESKNWQQNSNLEVENFKSLITLTAYRLDKGLKCTGR